MGLYGDLKADNRRCVRCGCLLYRNIGLRRQLLLLREFDDEIVIETRVAVRCGRCAGLNQISSIAEPLPPPLECKQAREFASIETS